METNFIPFLLQTTDVFFKITITNYYFLIIEIKYVVEGLKKKKKFYKIVICWLSSRYFGLSAKFEC